MEQQSLNHSHSSWHFDPEEVHFETTNNEQNTENYNTFPLSDRFQMRQQISRLVMELEQNQLKSSQLQNENIQLKQQLQSQQQNMEAYQALVQELQRQIKGILSQLHPADQQLLSFSHSQTVTIELAQVEIETLKAKLATRDEVIHQMRSLKVDQEELQDLKIQLALNEKELERLHMEVTQSQLICDLRGKRIHQLAQKNHQDTTTLQSTVQTLEMKQKMLLQEIQNITDRCLLLETENNTLTGKESKFVEQIESLTATIKSLEEQQRVDSITIDNLERQLDAFRTTQAANHKFRIIYEEHEDAMRKLTQTFQQKIDAMSNEYEKTIQLLQKQRQAPPSPIKPPLSPIPKMTASARSPSRSIRKEPEDLRMVRFYKLKLICAEG